ncbi:prostaglandin reductase 1-like isoform X4 [Bacillus rossius redtenbacheri]|uniref:prostaglandin reductase 1-like isoform X4 n=1 Tax=Bacillus rossius redtenbacheri TaxID=93214 RepID=UPI002FDCCC32
MVSIKPYTLLYRFINPLKHIVCGEVKTIFPSGFRSWSSAAGMVKARKFILAKHFVGEPKESDFQLVEEDLPELKNGEVLVEAEWLSVDPYMRPYTMWLPTGITMIGGQVARVVRSRDPAVPEGSRVMGYFGWRDRTVVDLSQPNSLPMPDKPYLLPDFQGLPPSLGVGVLGMPGLTALYGVREVLRPTPGGVVVVSGAAGAVGSLVGQIAKHAGGRGDEQRGAEPHEPRRAGGGVRLHVHLQRQREGQAAPGARGPAGPHLQGAADGGLHGAAVERPLAGGRPRDAAARQAGQAEVPRNGHPRF